MQNIYSVENYIKKKVKLTDGCVCDTLDTMISVATWVWEFLVEYVSLNTVHCVQKCNLKLLNKEETLNSVQKHPWIICASLSQIDRKRVDTCSVVCYWETTIKAFFCFPFTENCGSLCF